MDKRDQEPGQKVLRFGTAVVACALVLRLAGNGFFAPVTAWLQKPEVMSFLMYLQTGRIFRQAQTQQVTLPEEPEAPTEAVMAQLPSFAGIDGDSLAIRYNCEYRPDISALLAQPLNWNLRQDAPTVLILHTHGSESYTPVPGETYTETGSYRTLDENYNMLSIGAYLASLLEEAGIRVIHDKTLHDYPSYNGSYAASRETVEKILEENPSVCLVLDLHRDAAEDDSGNQIAHTVEADGQEAAKFMLVLGSDIGGLEYPNWQENLALGLKLQHTLESIAPGSCRSMNFCGQRYNQDLSAGALLVEVGSAGNTHSQAMNSMELLAKAIVFLAEGSQ